MSNDAAIDTDELPFEVDVSHVSGAEQYLDWLSPTMRDDYIACEMLGKSRAERARERDVRPDTITGNVSRAKQRLEEIAIEQQLERADEDGVPIDEIDWNCPWCGASSSFLIPVWVDMSDYESDNSPDYIACTECETMREADELTQRARRDRK